MAASTLASSGASSRQTTDRVNDTVRRIFGRVLKELADLDNPMRTTVGSEPGSGGLVGDGIGDQVTPAPSPPSGSDGDRAPQEPTLGELTPPRVDPVTSGNGDGESISGEPAQPDRKRTSHLPPLVPDHDPGEARSRFDADVGVVLYNDRHGDYLLVKESEPALLDYLATLVAKEYVVYNNPRSSPEDLAEEMVRMLVRVRRHLPRRAS